VIMNEATEDRHQTPITAARFRDGLTISLLAARPIRVRNLAAIRINHELRIEERGYRLEFMATETKGHRRIDLPLHPALTEYIDLYLRKYRPLLCDQASLAETGEALWVSARATVLSKEVVAQNIAKRTLEYLGVVVRPHQFRRCFATSIAIEDPVHVRAASAILGHADPSTTEKHYNRAKTLEAGRVYAKIIRYLSQSLAPNRQSRGPSLASRYSRFVNKK
jgi:integrase/recombinase XerD